MPLPSLVAAVVKRFLPPSLTTALGNEKISPLLEDLLAKISNFASPKDLAASQKPLLHHLD
ncbi:MAG: hypothetical protein IPK14_27925 [Blastocatellia bacterium]|nr:hypothetical protein [Blastocatellia bacterium]